MLLHTGQRLKLGINPPVLCKVVRMSSADQGQYQGLDRDLGSDQSTLKPMARGLFYHQQTKVSLSRSHQSRILVCRRAIVFQS